MAKRIYTLAKELGVDSKIIVAKCQAEGLADTVKNHMSTLSAGLEATIQEWFSEAEVAHTAVEHSDKVDVAAAKRKASKKRKKRKPKAKRTEKEAALAVAEARETEAAEAQIGEQEQAAEVLAPEEPQIKAPVKVAPPPKAIIAPSPKHVPEPAKLQGPKVIRVEAAERVGPIPARPRPGRPAKPDEPSVPLEPAAAFFFLVTLFVTWFFRNPERKTPEDEKVVVSPADGRILKIEEVEEDAILKGKFKKISIFMNIFNVHVNRIPYPGSVKVIQYKKGKFFSANLDKASSLNERNSVLVKTDDGREILTIQIAGLIARRIVCWIQEGIKVERGQRFGLIRFGSRLEVFLPIDSTISVKVGDRVKGGETPIGYLI